jgi:hypothetical protein
MLLLLLSPLPMAGAGDRCIGRRALRADGYVLLFSRTLAIVPLIESP